MYGYAKSFSFITGAVLVAGGIVVSVDAQVRARSQRAETAVIATPQATRAVDMFIKIDGIEGEASDRAHEQWIDVLSVSWGSSNSSARQPAPVGNGPGTLVLSRNVDRASPKLSEACTNGRSLGSVVVHTRANAGGYIEYVIGDARVRSCSQGSTGDRPTENVTLNFGRVESSGGNPDRPIVTGR